LKPQPAVMVVPEATLARIAQVVLVKIAGEGLGAAEMGNARLRCRAAVVHLVDTREASGFCQQGRAAGQVRLDR